MKNGLFSEFDAAGTGTWKQTIMRDLKGEPFDSLVWKNPNGFDVLPFYTGEEQQSPYLPAFTHPSWTMSVRPLAADAAALNQRLLHLLQKGASGIGCDDRGPVETILKDIRLDMISSVFYLPAQRLGELRRHLVDTYPSRSLDMRVVATGIRNEEDIRSWIDEAGTFSPWGASMLGIDAAAWSNAGALEYYEIALCFSLLVQWFGHAAPGLFERRGITIRTSVSTDLFTQIAKLRAYRRLWEIFGREFGLKADIHIVAETSLSSAAVTDPHNNMIRNTIAGFAAVTGGCNELVTHPHDALLQPGAESERLALNQQLILREECFLSRVADVSCGSYYIESLTDQLALRALDTFKEIQRNGGYFSLLHKGEIEQEIGRHAAAGAERVSREEQIIVGVNRFRAADPAAGIPAVLSALRSMGVSNPAVAFETNRAQKA